MFQAMGFLDFNITPADLEQWRSKSMHEWYSDRDPRSNAVEPAADFTQPLFVDSGGYKLMNAKTFGDRPSDGGEDNEWGIYTDPESILDLQLDYGADIIATLDYPIPPDLKEEERYARMESSIASAKQTLNLLEERENAAGGDFQRPSVYFSIHGHDYESINWFVRRVLDEVGDQASFDGFAVGSLVPLRSNIELLIDIVQGASMAIPKARRDELGLHVFGISGELFALLSLLGVDSFDSSSFVQSAQYQKIIHPETWRRQDVMDLDDTWTCQCSACQEMNIPAMQQTLDAPGRDYDDPHGFLKSDYYALLAQHNFEIYQDEIERVRDKIRDNDLLNYVLQQTNTHPKIRQGLKRAQRFAEDITPKIKASNVAGSDKAVRTQTKQLMLQGTGTTPVETDSKETRSDSISLAYTPADFDATKEPVEPIGCPVLLVLPCSQVKPYSESRTHKAVANTLEDIAHKYYKISLSGLYGPVPEPCETQDPVRNYEYVLSKVDTEQQQLVRDRLTQYLDQYGDRFNQIIGYATTKPYRGVIEDSFARTQYDTTLFPTNLSVQQLAEYFRNDHLEELYDAVNDA